MAASPIPTAPLAVGARINHILIDKSERVLIGLAGKREILRYRPIYFGDSPTGHKQFEGDEKTPEGKYRIVLKNPNSSYTLSLKIDYPNAADRAYAASKQRSPGGDIFIHGQPNAWLGPMIARDWTDGCIALSNAQMRQLYAAVEKGASISIKP